MDGEKRNELDKSLKLLAGASFIVFVTTILSKILTYIYRIVIARYYTPEVYGIYSISLMVMGWATVLMGFGFAGGLTRYMSYYRGKKEEYKSSFLVKNTSFILIISGIIGTLIVIFSSNFISNNVFKIPELKPFLIIFSLAIPFTLQAGVYFSVLKSYEKIGWLAFIVNVVQNLIKVFALIILIYLGFSSKSIAVSYVLGIIIALSLAYFVVLRKIPSLFSYKKIKKGKLIMVQLFSYSWPLIFFGFMSSILSWTDTLMVGILRGAREVGFYNAAIPLALLITLSTDLFRQMLLPLITKEYGKGDMEAVRIISKQVTKWLFIVSIPLFVGLFLFPQEAIKILFGVEYLPATNALRILTIGFFISSVLDVSQEALSMKGKSRLILVDILAIAGFNLVLNYILIPVYGITGAAISTMISLSILSVLFTYQTWKNSGIFIMKKDINNVILSGIIAFVMTWIVSNYLGRDIVTLILIGLFFTLIYLLSLYLTRSIDENDYLIIKAVKGKIFRLSGIRPIFIDQ